MKIKALILFLFLALWGVLFFLNPTLLSGSQTLLASLPSIKIPSSFYFAPTVVDAQEELKMYRGNRQRHGVSQEVLSLPLSKTVLATGVNESPYLAAKSSPVIDETGLYVGSDRGEFLAYNLDGSLKWKFAPLPAMTGIHGTALLGPDSVVFGSYNGRLYSLDKKEGRVQWSIELASPGSIGSSPLQDREGFLYVSVELPSPDGFIVKLDKVDGHVVWLSKNVGDHPHSSPVLDEEHRQVVFGSNNDRVSSFDLDSGQLKWVMQVRGAVKSTPLVWGDKIYVTDRGGFLSALDAGTGKVLWQQQLGSEGLHGSPVIVPELERVYSVTMNGALLALNMQTGEVQWKVQRGKWRYRMSPVSSLVRIQGRQEWALWLECHPTSLCVVSARDGRILESHPLSGRFSGEVVFYKKSAYMVLDNPGDLLQISSGK